MILAEQDERQDRRRYFRPETLVAIDALVPIDEVSRPLPDCQLTDQAKDDALLQTRWDSTSMSSRLSC